MSVPSEAQQAILLTSLRAHLRATSPSSSASTQDGQQQPYEDDDILRSLLAVEDWNVSRAVALFKQSIGGDATAGGGSSATPSTEDDAATARRIQQMEIDDSNVGGIGETLRTERAPLWNGGQQLYRRTAGGTGGGRVGLSYGGTGTNNPFAEDDRLQHARGAAAAAAAGQPPNGWPSIWNILYQTLTLPFSIAQGLLLFLLRLLRIRPGGGVGGSGGGSGSVSRHHPSAGTRMTIDARAAAEQYIRDLEHDLAESTNGVESGSQQQRSKTYPPLFVGSYSQACQRAKDELKVLAIVLTSIDNPNSDIFRRQTLTDPSLVEVLSRPEFLVWAGDIREREAWQVADICDATSFPFVAFVSLQPSRTSRSSSSLTSSSSTTPRLAVLSRHSGTALVKPTPATAARQLQEHLTGLLVPRVQPYLSRLGTERARLASERALRAEQDAAFERAAQADVARVRARREAEMRREEEERKKREEETRREEEKRRLESWRSWARARLVPAEGLAESEDEKILIQFRLPGGRSLSRSFGLDDELEGVFAYIETASLVGGSAEGVGASGPPQGYEHEYGFELVLGGYPRRKVTPAEINSTSNGKTRLRDVSGLNDARRANVIVEGAVAGMSVTSGGQTPQDGDDSSGEDSD
ncbi:hypothetical protein A4X13_0g2734 [Tilletia indica]|uniref:Uncharacterized protein n=1 Tax=Tilletia indica TaxID=43049 RepID=A0A177TBE7_9BASI|nr:hypothetical protein A4X13_0g2734 [Tilletia indica]